MTDIDHFAQFIRGTQAPPPDATIAASPAAQAGQTLFESIGCNICHIESITTAAPATLINGGTYSVQGLWATK